MAPNTMEPYRWTVRGVEPELVRQLRILAIRTNANLGELVNAMLRAYLRERDVKV